MEYQNSIHTSEPSCSCHSRRKNRIRNYKETISFNRNWLKQNTSSENPSLQKWQMNGLNLKHSRLSQDGNSNRLENDDQLSSKPSMSRLGCHSSIPHIICFLLVILMCLVQPIHSLHTPNLDRYSPSFDVWDFRESLDPDGAFIVEWTPVHDKVNFRVTVETKGYIGFGLSTTGQMDGADIVVGWVHSGKAYLQDRHGGRGNIAPIVDDQQDWMLVWGFENDTHTVLIMSRPYNTCDDKDHVISNDTVSLLWAYHPDDPVDPESPRPRLHYHGQRRGSRSAFLIQRPTQHQQEYVHRNAMHTWTLNNPNVLLDSKTILSDTLYWCKIFKRPPLVQKNHVVRYEPVFTKGSEPQIHHMIVYECTNLDPLNEPVFDELSKQDGHPCYNSNISQLQRNLLLSCNHVVVVWAIGSKGLSLPPEAGYPLTPNGPKFYMMETHYEVPLDPHPPFWDSSGVKVFYTSALRNYDAGVLSVGMDPIWKHLIPPKQPTMMSQGHCIGECTRQTFPKTGINIFAVTLHTHLLGRRVQVRHIRKNKELEPIAADNNYNFNFQEYRALKKARLVMPGDHLISECVYNSTERSTITLGGFKTRDEKCLSFLFYWPRVDLSFCHSRPSLNTVLLSLGIYELSNGSNPIKIKQPVNLAGKTLKWRLQNYDWDQHFEYFQNKTQSGLINQMCWKRGESIIPDLENIDYEQPNITDPWRTPNVCHKRGKGKNRRRKKGPRPRQDPENPYDIAHRNHQHHGDGNFEDEFFDDGVMFDDDTEINDKPIERIDVDPVHSVDFLPVIKTNRDPIDPGHSEHQYNSRRDYEDERILKEEFINMERELEKEVNRLPDNFQERTAHHNIVKIDPTNGQDIIITSRTFMCINLCILLLYYCICKN